MTLTTLPRIIQVKDVRGPINAVLTPATTRDLAQISGVTTNVIVIVHFLDYRANTVSSLDSIPGCSITTLKVGLCFYEK